MAEQILIVFTVLAALASLLWVLRRKGFAQFAHVKLPARKRTASRQLELMERLPLTPNHSVHLIRAGESIFLIGVSPGSCQTLSTFPAPSPSFADSQSAVGRN